MIIGIGVAGAATGAAPSVMLDDSAEDEELQRRLDKIEQRLDQRLTTRTDRPNQDQTVQT